MLILTKLGVIFHPPPNREAESTRVARTCQVHDDEEPSAWQSIDPYRREHAIQQHRRRLTASSQPMSPSLTPKISTAVSGRAMGLTPGPIAEMVWPDHSFRNSGLC